MNTILGGLAALATVAALAGCALFCLAYFGLRLTGRLSVNAGGWHASEIRLGRWQAVSALALFQLFGAPMRAESSIRRWFGLGVPVRTEQGISDVVVELITMA